MTVKELYDLLGKYIKEGNGDLEVYLENFGAYKLEYHQVEIDYVDEDQGEFSEDGDLEVLRLGE